VRERPLLALAPRDEGASGTRRSGRTRRFGLVGKCPRQKPARCDLWLAQAAGSECSGGLSVGVARRVTAVVIWSLAWMARATAFTVPRRRTSRTLGELRAAPAATAIPSGGEAAAARAAAATLSSVWLCAAGALSVGSFCVGSDIKHRIRVSEGSGNRPAWQTMESRCWGSTAGARCAPDEAVCRCSVASTMSRNVYGRDVSGAAETEIGVSDAGGFF